MFMSKNRLWMTILFLAVVTMLAGSALGLAPYGRDDLHFELVDTTAYVIGSVDPPGLNAFSLPVKVYFEADPGLGNITKVQITFTYDINKYDRRLEYLPGSWPYDVTIYENTPGTVQLVLDGGAFSPPITENADPLVYLRLNAFCQPEHSYDDLEIVANPANSYITTTTYNDYYPGLPENWHNSTVTIADYDADFSLADEVPAFLGNEVIVPCSLLTNFRMSGFRNKIQYNPALLQFLGMEVNNSLFPNGLDPDTTAVTDIGGYLDIKLFNDMYYSPLVTVKTWIYQLHFKVLATSDNIISNLTFVQNESYARVFYAGEEDYCDLWQEPIDLDPGSVKIPLYKAHYKEVWDGAKKISKFGDNSDMGFNIKMYNEFPAGIGQEFTGPEGLISANFNFGTVWTGMTKTGEDPELSFGQLEYTNGTRLVSFFQTYTSGKDNWWPEKDDYYTMFSFTADFDNTGYAPTSYINRYVTIPFTTTFPYGPGMTTQVTDITQNVHATIANARLDFSYAGVEAAVGEFMVPYASSTTSINVSQDFYIRNNFSLGEFSIKVTVSPHHRISSVITRYPNVAATRIASNQYRIYSLPGFTLPPNGDLTTRMATINYQTITVCYKGTGQTFTSSVSFSEEYMKDDAAVAQYVVKVTNNVRSKCVWNDPIPIDDDMDKAGVAGLPTEFRLYPNHPNPFNPETMISFDVPEVSHVRIVVLNILGQQVATLVDEQKVPGRYEVTWKGSNDIGQRVSSGVYLAVMQSGNYSGTVKMSLMK